MSCLLIFTSIYPLIGFAMEMYGMKRLLNFLKTRTLLIQQKITEKVGLYTNNTFFSYLVGCCPIPDLGKCHSLPGGGAPENWGGSGTFSSIKRGDQKIFSN